MNYKDIDKVIESQVKFVKDNSNSVSNRIQILNSLLISIKPVSYTHLTLPTTPYV